MIIRASPLTREQLPLPQQVLLDVIENTVGRQWDHTAENMTELMADAGLHRGTLIRQLHSLRSKGFLSCTCRSDGRPRVWRLEAKGCAGEDGDAKPLPSEAQPSAVLG